MKKNRPNHMKNDFRFDELDEVYIQFFKDIRWNRMNKYLGMHDKRGTINLNEIIKLRSNPIKEFFWIFKDEVEERLFSL
jgi:hypothetical protein